jgi:hypothetical protein
VGYSTQYRSGSFGALKFAAARFSKRPRSNQRPSRAVSSACFAGFRPKEKSPANGAFRSEPLRVRGWGAGSGPRQQLVALAYVPLTIERRDRRPRLEVHSTRASHDPGKGATIPDARLLSRPGPFCDVRRSRWQKRLAGSRCGKFNFHTFATIRLRFYPG